MSGPGVGLYTVVGTAVEATYGTPVTPNRFFEILGGESLARRNRLLVSNGLRGGARNLRRGSRRVLSARDGGGDLPMEVPTTTFGRWLEQTLGGVSTIAQQGLTPAYLQTHQMGDLSGKSQTVQKQIRDSSNAEVESFTFHGCKVLAAEFSIGVDRILQVTFTLDAEDVDTATPAAAPSYANVKLFHFGQVATLTVAGAAVAAVTDATIRIENPQKTDRYYLGSAGVKKEPRDNDFPAVTGTMSAEFNSPADFYDRFAADSGAELVMAFEGDTISGAYKEMIRFTIPDIRFTGGTPTVAGADVVVTDVPYEATYDGTNPGAKIEYQSTDVAI